jgi:hypothetical protein
MLERVGGQKGDHPMGKWEFEQKALVKAVDAA